MNINIYRYAYIYLRICVNMFIYAFCYVYISKYLHVPVGAIEHLPHFWAQARDASRRGAIWRNLQGRALPVGPLSAHAARGNCAQGENCELRKAGCAEDEGNAEDSATRRARGVSPSNNYIYILVFIYSCACINMFKYIYVHVPLGAS